MTQKNIFDLKSTAENSAIHLISVPWDVTASYKKGTAQGPSIILDASHQLEHYHHQYKNVFDAGIFLHPENKEIKQKNTEINALSQTIIKKFDNHDTITPEDHKNINTINEACLWLSEQVYEDTEKMIQKEKLIGMIGGDHSTSLGVITALSDYIDTFGILQFDAHMDLRPSYQHFTQSHASIMHNILEIKDISRLIQVGVRDYSQEELTLSKQSKGRIKTYFNHDIKKELYSGKTWEYFCKKIINNCPDKLYISFDIDVLTPQYCPSTGTPVPGGLEFDQIEFLIAMLVKAKKQIIGFDIVEVAGEQDSIDAITGARILSMLCGYCYQSNEE